MLNLKLTRKLTADEREGLTARTDGMRESIAAIRANQLESLALQKAWNENELSRLTNLKAARETFDADAMQKSQAAERLGPLIEQKHKQAEKEGEAMRVTLGHEVGASRKLVGKVCAELQPALLAKIDAALAPFHAPGFYTGMNELPALGELRNFLHPRLVAVNFMDAESLIALAEKQMIAHAELLAGKFEWSFGVAEPETETAEVGGA